MICPHCKVGFHDSPTEIGIGVDADGFWSIRHRTCPECKRYIIELENITEEVMIFDDVPVTKYKKTYFIRPKTVSRSPCPSEVSKELAEDYKEACLVLPDSPKASAALSRRCLQNLLREVEKVKPSNLFNEIQEVLNKKTLPSHLASNIETIRIIGNFAAHPTKSEKSGEIIPVELGEAEWNLDVLEGLFDFYFVQPAITDKKRVALNKKLQAAGKEPMK